MKRVFLFVICIVLLISLCACKSTPALKDDNVSPSGYNPTLIRSLSATDDVSAIQSFEIIHEYSSNKTLITNTDDLTFLQKYTYSHIYPSDELDKLFLFPKNHIINIKVNDYTNTLYLMEDGSIAMRQMCGDSGVADVPYEVYKADGKYMLNQKRLIELLKKYNGYN